MAVVAAVMPSVVSAEMSAPKAKTNGRTTITIPSVVRLRSVISPRSVISAGCAVMVMSRVTTMVMVPMLRAKLVRLRDPALA